MSTDPTPADLSSSGAVESYMIALGLPPITYDAAGRIDLEVDGIPLTFCIADAGEQILWIGCDVGEVAHHDRALHEWLLQAALGSWSRFGAKLGVDKATSRVVLHLVLAEARVTETLLHQIMPTLMDDARELKARLEARNFTPTTDPDETAPHGASPGAPERGAIFG